MKRTVERLFHMVDSAIYCFSPEILKQDIRELAALIYYLGKKQIECLLEMDPDVIIPKIQIRSEKVVMAYPYNGRFCVLTKEQSICFTDKTDEGILVAYTSGFDLPTGDYSVGGAFLINKYMYLNAGGENENFYGWGPEDLERLRRIKILGLPVYRAAGCLFHLHHPQNENSDFATSEL